ncbi:MAG TPA: hypothetical protein VLV50_18235 [Stellaceae bacterium]|nr:hypothetical protein [Stellaceae bacterium]
MAVLLPATIAPPNDSAESQLEAMLARLPADWTILVERRIGGTYGPYVPFVLLHRDIGVALVDLTPADLDAAINALRALTMQAGIGEPPIVAVTVVAGEIDHIANLLAAAFTNVAPLDAVDPHWQEVVIGLLMSAEDVPMAPLRSAAPVCEEDLDEPPPPRRSGFDRYWPLTITAVAAVIAELIFYHRVRRLNQGSPKPSRLGFLPSRPRCRPRLHRRRSKLRARSRRLRARRPSPKTSSPYQGRTL